MPICIYIPARLNSQRLERKVIRDFNGDTLISIILKKLNQSKYSNNFILNTSDNELVEYASSLGFKTYKRSNGLANNDTTTEEILLDFAKNYEGVSNAKYIAAINPTNPLLSIKTINNFLDKVRAENTDTAFSVTKLKKHCLIDRVPINYSPFGPHPRTQDVKEVIFLNWAIVAWKKQLVLKNITKRGDSIYLGNVSFIEIPEHESTDIDTAYDFENALKLHKIYNLKPKTIE